MEKRIKVFISYSWDSEAHKEWALNLAMRLRKEYGVDVILDQFDLSVGKNMVHFMERSVEIADKVLLILTPGYKQKALDRTRGVGFEYSMISTELYNSEINNSKFLPVLRSGSMSESAPPYISTMIAHLMVDDSTIDSDLFVLARIIYDKPQVIKPELGPIPNFDKEVEKDATLERARALSTRLELKKRKGDHFYKNAANEIIKQFHHLLDELDKKAQYYKENTGFFFSLTDRVISSYVNDYSYGNLIGEGGICFHFSLKIIERKIFIAISKWDKRPIGTSTNTFYFPGGEPKQLSSEELYELDIDDSLEFIWKDIDGSFLKIEDLSRKYFGKLMDEIIKFKEGN